MLVPPRLAASTGTYSDPPQPHYEAEHMASHSAWRDVHRPASDPVSLLLRNFASQAAELGNGARPRPSSAGAPGRQHATRRASTS